MNKLTNRGNLKNKSNSNEVLIDKRAVRIFKYWQKQGFPYYKTDKEFRRNEFDKFMKIEHGLTTHTHLKSNVITINRLMISLKTKKDLVWQFVKH